MKIIIIISLFLFIACESKIASSNNNDLSYINPYIGKWEIDSYELAEGVNIMGTNEANLFLKKIISINDKEVTFQNIQYPLLEGKVEKIIFSNDFNSYNFVKNYKLLGCNAIKLKIIQNNIIIRLFLINSNIISYNNQGNFFICKRKE